MPLYKCLSKDGNFVDYSNSFVGILWDDGEYTCCVCGMTLDVGYPAGSWRKYELGRKHFREFHEGIWAAIMLMGGRIGWTKKEDLRNRPNRDWKYIEVDLGE